MRGSVKKVSKHMTEVQRQRQKEKRIEIFRCFVRILVSAVTSILTNLWLESNL